MPRLTLFKQFGIFLFLFGSLASAGDLIFHSHVEDAAIDIKGNLYVLKIESVNHARRFLVSRYDKSGQLDRSYANQGHLLVQLKLKADNTTGNGKLTICPATGDLIVAFGTFRKPETPALDSGSTVADITSLFNRTGNLGDNRTLLLRFSEAGRMRGEISAFKVSSDNSDRLYSLGTTRDGKILVSWRSSGSTILYVRKANGSAHRVRRFENADGDIFSTNVATSGRGGFRAAGVALEDTDEEEVARPVVFRGKNLEILDRVFPEVSGNRGLQTALIVPGYPKQMVVIAPENDTHDRLERIELSTGDGQTELALPTPGKVVSEIVRPTPAKNMLIITSKPRISAFIAAEIDPMSGRVVRERTVGEILSDAGGLIPKCLDLIQQ